MKTKVTYQRSLVYLLPHTSAEYTILSDFLWHFCLVFPFIIHY